MDQPVLAPGFSVVAPPVSQHKKKHKRHHRHRTRASINDLPDELLVYLSFLVARVSTEAIVALSACGRRFHRIVHDNPLKMLITFRLAEGTPTMAARAMIARWGKSVVFLDSTGVIFEDIIRTYSFPNLQHLQLTVGVHTAALLRSLYDDRRVCLRSVNLNFSTTGSKQLSIVKILVDLALAAGIISPRRKLDELTLTGQVRMEFMMNGLYDYVSRLNLQIFVSDIFLIGAPGHCTRALAHSGSFNDFAHRPQHTDIPSFRFAEQNWSHARFRIRHTYVISKDAYDKGLTQPEKFPHSANMHVTHGSETTTNVIRHIDDGGGTDSMRVTDTITNTRQNVTRTRTNAALCMAIQADSSIAYGVAVLCHQGEGRGPNPNPVWRFPQSGCASAESMRSNIGWYGMRCDPPKMRKETLQNLKSWSVLRTPTKVTGEATSVPIVLAHQT